MKDLFTNSAQAANAYMEKLCVNNPVFTQAWFEKFSLGIKPVVMRSVSVVFKQPFAQLCIANDRINLSIYAHSPQG